MGGFSGFEDLGGFGSIFDAFFGGSSRLQKLNPLEEMI